MIAESLQLREKIGKVVSTLTEKPQEDIKLEPSDHESEAAQQEILDEKEVGDERPDEADQVQGDNFVIMREEIEQEEETAQEEVVPMGAGEDQVLDVIDVSGEQSSTLPAVVHPSTTGIGGIVMESETPSLFDALDEMGRDEVVSELMPIAMPALPEAGSIAEMRDKEQTISPQVQQALTSLREKVPALGFEDLTPDQVLHMHSFVEKKAEAGRAEIVKDLTDFASTVLMAAASYMRGELPQKTLRIFEEIQRRDGAGDFWFE